MADMLNDYSGMAGAGAAFEGFAEGFSKALDSKQKRMEHQAMMEATKAKMQREQDQVDVDRFKSGVMRGEDGKMQRRPLTEQEIAEKKGKYLNPEHSIEFDDQGNPVRKEFSPEYIQMKKDVLLADPHGTKAIAAALAKQNLDKVTKENSEKSREAASTPVPGFIKGPGYNADKIQERALTDAFVSVNKFNTIMGNLKEKVSRSRTLDLANPSSNARKAINQDLKNLQLLYKGPAFAQLGVLAGPDMEILEQVIESPATLSNLISGKDGVSSRYDELLKTVNSGFKESLSAHGLVADPNYVPKKQRADLPPQGLVKPPEQGLIGKVGGYLSRPFSSAPAQASGPTPVDNHPQDMAAVTWAKANPKDPRAAAILKANGL